MNAIACHPRQALLAVGSRCGLLKVWDYQQTTYLVSRIFPKAGIQCLSYDPEGMWTSPPSPCAKRWASRGERLCHEGFLACFAGYFLAAGFTDGSVYILDAISLQSSCKELKFSRGPVTHIGFSHDSEYLATAVSLFSALGDLHVPLMVQLLVGLGITGHSARHSRASGVEGASWL